jgi:hypothetical protein
MATDRDRYGTQLGKRFLAVRAAICSGSGRVAADAVGAYIERCLFKNDSEIKALFGETVAVVSARNGWLLSNHDVEMRRLIAKGSRSLAASHLVEAAQDVVRSSGGAVQILRRMAARAIDETEARLHTQRDYVRDVEAHRAFHLIRPLAIVSVEKRLAIRLGLEASLSTAKQRPDRTAELLDLVVTSRRVDVHSN